MKKILFASTALVASVGIAAADSGVDVTGAAEMGFKYDGSNWTADYGTTISFAMSGETDGGLSFGADLDLTFSNGGNAVTDNQVVYIEGGFGKFSIGTVDNAIVAVTGLSDIGYDGLGTDDLAEVLRGSSAANMSFTGSRDSFSYAISYDMGRTDDWAVGGKYSMGDYSIALGYGKASAIKTDGTTVATLANAEEVLAVQLGAAMGDFSLAALYTKSSIDAGNVLTIGGVAAPALTAALDLESYGVTAGYTMGQVTVNAAYSKFQAGTSSVDGYGLGVSYDLGGGATLDAGVGEIGGTTVADLGINMSF